ncbi:Zinc finger protein 253 [Chionoecetes opilio]|uniref:Zinc finger protein 253 n=1 Tax=Chionoecetes opilio TaxID=41210 RepID=A0A8J4YM02_CHIOP|nr:Zinc finger protein 253 [Chionoecetes opilio]
MLAAYVDLKKAFQFFSKKDSVHRESLWDLVRLHGVPAMIVGLLSGTESAVKCGAGVSSFFPVNIGVRQSNLYRVAGGPGDGSEALHEEAKPLGLMVSWPKTKVQMSGGGRSSTPADPGGSRSLFPVVLRQDMRGGGQAGSAPHYPATSVPGSGLVTQGAPLMALGPNVMFPGGRLMPGAAHDAHRYMTEAYRLAVGESEAQRMPYTAAASSGQSLGAETHRSTPDINPNTGDRPQPASQRQSQNEHPEYIAPPLPPHLNLDSSRGVEGHSSRVLSSPERLSHNTSRINIPKNENDSVPYGKAMFPGNVDSTHLSSQVPKSKGSSAPVAGSSHMFPVSFPPPYQQYSEEGAANFKRQYYDEAFTPRREALSDTSNTGGESPQVSRGRSDSGEAAAAASHLSRFENECPNQDIFCREDSSRGGSSPELGLLAQATISEHSDLLMRSKLAKGRHCKTYRCQMCDQEFKNGTQLKNHTWRHTGEKPYSCTICQATFTQQSNLKTHMRIHTGERPYTCEECSATFTQISNLRTHQKIHTGEKPYECDICFTSFSQQSNLKSHKLIHSGERPFKCEICGASFVQSTHLRNHKRIHTDERPYSCNQCGAKFRQLSNLKTHEKIHTGERPYGCEECGAAFAQKSNLKSHMIKLHSNDGISSKRGRKKKLEPIRPFICEECGAKFTIMSNLKIHMRLHSGEKPFQCTSCDASFAQRSNLKSHEHIHNDERPHKCSECSAAFRQKTNLKTHKMKKHPVKSLKIKILCDTQYVMEDDMPDEEGGVSSQQMIGEPIVQIREGQGDQMPGLSGGTMEGEELIKLEADPYGRQATSSGCRTPNLLSQPCSSEHNPYDNPNF